VYSGKAVVESFSRRKRKRSIRRRSLLSFAVYHTRFRETTTIVREVERKEESKASVELFVPLVAIPISLRLPPEFPLPSLSPSIISLFLPQQWLKSLTRTTPGLVSSFSTSSTSSHAHRPRPHSWPLLRPPRLPQLVPRPPHPLDAFKELLPRLRWCSHLLGNRRRASRSLTRRVLDADVADVRFRP
jgi:hypothetical protein